MIEIEENDCERRARTAVTLDFRVESFDQTAIVCQAGEWITFRQLTYMLLGAFVRRGFGGQNHGSYGNDGHERLQQQQRSIFREPDERAVAVDCSPSGYKGENANCRGGFSTAKTKRGPNQKWETEIFEGIIFDDVVKAVAEDEPGRCCKSEKQ